MPQNFESDFIKAARKLKQNKRKALEQRIGKFFIIFTILLVAIILQANPSLFTHSSNSSKDFITRLKYNPIPPSLTSPWAWKNHETIHPIVTSLTPDIEKSIKSVANYIAQQESDPYLRIKALHDYVISRLTYDLNVLKTGIRPAQDAQTVFSTRKAVCEGYANLFMALGREIGVEVVFIGGKVRRDLAPVDLIPMTSRLLNSNYDWTLHAWNAVKVADNWQLVDTTWDDSDSGKYSADYLMPPPEVMIASHFPQQSDWQLLHSPKNQVSFEKQLLLTPEFFIEKLQIVSPREYQTDVQRKALIEVKKPPTYQKKIVAFFAERKKFGFSVWSLPDSNPFTQENRANVKICQSQYKEGEITQISCQFPDRGDYQVILFSFEQGNDKVRKKMSPIVQLRFNVL